MLPTLRSLTLRTWFAFTLLALAGPASASQPVPAGPLAAGPIRFELAIYFLDAPATDPMGALRTRLKAAGMPTLVASLPAKPDTAFVTADLTTTVQKNYRPPSLDMLQRFGRGLSRDQVLALQRSERALVLRFKHPSTITMPAYRSALVLLDQLARDSQGLLWDEETREVFTPDEWRKRRLDTWFGDTPDVSKHTVIHAYKGDKQVRAITLGMVKFGLPDVVVDDFAWSSNRSMGNLLNIWTQAMVEGVALKTAGRHDLDLRSLRHPAVRDSQLPTLQPNSSGIARLSLVKGTPETGDPENRLIEIRFDRYPGPDHYARQDALLSALFGTEDSVARVKHTDELKAASEAARAKLPALRAAFNKGLQPGEYIQLKLPFPIPTGGNEWMWVEVMSWDGDTIVGLLKNEPVNIPTLHGGQQVTVSQSKVFDYLRRDAKGGEEGNQTSQILLRMRDTGK